MKFAVQLNPQVSIDKPAPSLMPTLIEQVRVADATGFHAFSMGEHYNIPGLQRLHQVPALARLCAEVKNCAVGTAVTLLGLRHPVTVANELASLDVINNGKSFAAFGLGYRDDELNAFQLTKSQRFHRFVEGIEIIKRLWMEDHVSFEGKEFQIKDVTLDPKPSQKPRPPVWIAANSDTAVERAAKIGDGWIIGPHSAIDELERQVDLCRKAWSAAAKAGEPDLPIIRETFAWSSSIEPFILNGSKTKRWLIPRSSVGPSIGWQRIASSSARSKSASIKLRNTNNGSPRTICWSDSIGLPGWGRSTFWRRCGSSAKR